MSPHPKPLSQEGGDSSSAQTISPPHWEGGLRGGVREERKEKSIFMPRRALEENGSLMRKSIKQIDKELYFMGRSLI